MTNSLFGRLRSASLAAVWLLAACSSHTVEDGESFGEAQYELNGSLNPKGFLTKRSFAETSEALRQKDTDEYYGRVFVSPDGVSASDGTISSRLGMLSDFRTFYHFDVSEQVAYYYNRGDLGIGREMHCTDRSKLSDKQIACYVRNFAAGDGEFRFGQSANVAFKNMHDPSARAAFATVAMVYRELKQSHENRVFFVVYDENEERSNFAALDRHGFDFVNGKVDSNGQLGAPGTNFNNHIPSNCMNCHGGMAYDSQLESQVGALFLPFDLDQFEYEDIPGRTRNDQLAAFKTLNEMVRKVAALSEAKLSDLPPDNLVRAAALPPAINLKNQLDGWYNNSNPTTPVNEVFENAFNSAFVPGGDQQPPTADNGWNADAASRSIYASVVRPTCRGCHTTVASPPLAFNTESQFLGLSSLIVTDLCSSQMPHALQTLRLFWQSSQPKALEDYLVARGKTGDAGRLRDCNPGNLVTLDPQHITLVP